ncbi:hypothetical protein [Bradyrhizobium sp. AZCC 2230]|uniref:hypothetical protein n=1 Tax=Bradyrhizobium sp. AZCC 2230 TaxID=3117021 RepID=UPI002FF0ED52
MLKYVAKISMDIFPSVLATIIGAYIVNHYINARPAADTPAAIVAPAEAGKDAKPADTANLPAPGVKAKGVSEKNVTEKATVEKSETKATDVKATDVKAADVAPAETASHGRPAAREKAAAKSAPAATAPVVEANSAPAAATPDANDLARAAIERLRKSPEGKAAEAKSAESKSVEAKSVEPKSAETKPAERTFEPAVREAARTPEAPRVISLEPSAVRPLPPPITVSTPLPEAYGNGGSSQGSPSYTASVGNDDPNRMTPPADIPVPVIAPPLDLRADAGASMPRPKKTNVADEMLSGMKSMFHSVLPKSSTPD